MVFPIFKLGGLLFKTVMKPVSSGLKAYAAHNPTFSKGCYWVANTYYRSYNSLLKGLRLPYQVTPLTNEQAVKLGTELVGEGVVLGGAVGVLYYEYQKSSNINKTSGDCNNLREELKEIRRMTISNEKRFDQFTLSYYNLIHEQNNRIDQLERNEELRGVD